MDFTAVTCGCSDEDRIRSAVTVPAGSVSGGLSACRYELERSSLPDISFQDQNYSEGFCPDTALMLGTLYPELVHIYK